MTARIGRLLAAVILIAASANEVGAQDGMIGVNFLGSAPGSALSPAEMAGLVPQGNWNNAGATANPQVGGLAQILSPSPGVLVDNSGAALPGVNIAWAAATTWAAGNSGSPDHKLMDGYIDHLDGSPTTTVRVTGIPYEHYAVVAYMGSDGNGRTGTLALSGAGSVNFVTNSAGFTEYIENANFALFEGQFAGSFTLYNFRGSNNSGIHGLQIIEQAGPAPRNLSLAAYYSFDNAANVMQDSQGLNNGVLVGNATQGAGRFGAGALSLDSAGDWGEVSAPTVDVKPTSDLAISVWVNRTDAAAGEVVSLGDHYGLRINGDGTVHFFEDFGNGWVGLTTSSTVPSELIPADGSWHHIVAQRSSNHFQVSIDGVLATSPNAYIYDTRPIDYDGLGTALFVGKHGNGSSDLDFGGRIDELRIFNGLLSNTEIQNLYTANAVPEPSTWALAATALLLVAPRLRRRHA